VLKNARRLNFYFRQTKKAFSGAKQAKIYAKIRRSMPYSLLHFSKTQFAKFKKLVSLHFGKALNFGIMKPKYGEKQLSSPKNRGKVGKKMGQG
jgi:hypothetical protein